MIVVIDKRREMHYGRSQNSRKYEFGNVRCEKRRPTRTDFEKRIWGTVGALSNTGSCDWTVTSWKPLASARLGTPS